MQKTTAFAIACALCYGSAFAQWLPDSARKNPQPNMQLKPGKLTCAGKEIHFEDVRSRRQGGPRENSVEDISVETTANSVIVQGHSRYAGTYTVSRSTEDRVYFSDGPQKIGGMGLDGSFTLTLKAGPQITVTCRPDESRPYNPLFPGR